MITLTDLTYSLSVVIFIVLDAVRASEYKFRTALARVGVIVKIVVCEAAEADSVLIAVIAVGDEVMAFSA